MDKSLVEKLVTQEAHANLAETWFKFIGYVGATALFEAAAEKADSTTLEILKWVCFALLFNWINYKVNKLTWALFPSTSATNTDPSVKAVSISVFSVSLIMFGVYHLVQYLVSVFLTY
ncbi:hypothetical protein DFP83_11314 [Idiomarina fontislapidosi]|uniref:Uncharacterized protein n=1 Tax=Idiomarina fontislapidosi TaxID=263723 RepID=A0A432XR68_9GAMM|nr:hypothetical protein [Idiomarina fontislapidosi]PYE30816.1 hypothetical protein DFP83_11314 [Idiomarina fontislapidosi]RUO51182.1 hypothetical protein CWE25_11525 [Idiomarina fontislapidosi]